MRRYACVSMCVRVGVCVCVFVCVYVCVCMRVLMEMERGKVAKYTAIIITLILILMNTTAILRTCNVHQCFKVSTTAMTTQICLTSLNICQHSTS